MIEKIYIRRIGPSVAGIGASYGAFNSAGELLAHHFCSGDQWALCDLGFFSPENDAEGSHGARRRGHYASLYPDGFEVINQIGYVHFPGV